MKKLCLIAISAILCLCSANAQEIYIENDSTDVDEFVEVTDASEIVDTQSQITTSNSMLDMVQGFAPLRGDAGRLKERVYPLGKGLFKKHHLEQVLMICPSITKTKASQSEVISGVNIDNIDETGINLNFGYAIDFIPGYEDNGKLRLNKPGFAYSAGFLASLTSTDRYGMLCDFLAKVGIETCRNRKMGIILDLLGGYGKSPGDFFFYKNIVEDTEPTSSIPYTKWGWKYGAQIGLKTGMFGNNSLLSNTDVILFVRFVKAPNAEASEHIISSVSFQLWREENWSYGVILRYRM